MNVLMHRGFQTETHDICMYIKLCVYIYVYATPPKIGVWHWFGGQHVTFFRCQMDAKLRHVAVKNCARYQGLAWRYGAIACLTSNPVWSQRSSPRCQYSYCALRILARKAAVPGEKNWCKSSLSFKKRHARSMCWVPAFLTIFSPFGSLWVFNVTYFGLTH